MMAGNKPPFFGYQSPCQRSRPNANLKVTFLTLSSAPTGVHNSIYLVPRVASGLTPSRPQSGFVVGWPFISLE
jgi:hypothetical protein